MRGLRAAAAFLTRIPVTSHVMEPGELAFSVRWFPLVGALVGVVVGGTYALGAQWLPSLVAGLIAVLVGAMFTGGLHEDGLGDVADAFGGGSDAADVARILKDPRQGTFGVLAIAGALLLRAAALAGISPIDGLAMAVAAHAIGRAVVVVAMRVFHSVGDGLAANYSRAVRTIDLVVALGLGVGIGGVAAGIWMVPSLALAFAAAWITGRLSLKKLGGVNGDTFGAIEQVTETAIFVLGAAIAHEGWIRAAWWA